MASTLSIDLASSQLPRGLTWSCSTVQKLVRAASFRCRSKSTTHHHHHKTLASKPPSLSRARSYGGRDAVGWGMVPVLNELLDVTASQLHRQRRSLSTPSDGNQECQPQAQKQKARCLNCQRRYSLTHDAASRPQHGFCSLDCRASHEYMGTIDANLDWDNTGLLKTSLNSTLESTYSPVEPVSHVTFHTRP